MKAIKYIAAIALLAGLVSCQQEVKQDIQILEPVADAVKVNFKVEFPDPIPVTTKGHMGEGPTIADGFNISLCLYGPGDGYVQHWIPAELGETYTSGGYITGGEFTVYLPLTDEKRVIHIIANPPFAEDASGDYVYPTSDYIYNIMDKLVTEKDSDDECSYWQEIILENGIQADSNGPSQEVRDAFSNIHLVRNFARFSVIGSDDEDFTIGRWALINVPNKAYVAPYNGDHSVVFPKGYTDIATYTSGDALLAQLTGTDEGQDNYPGYFPAETDIIDTFPGDPDGEGASNYTEGGYQYMYERPLPNSAEKQTSVLVEVTFGPEHALTAAYNELYGTDEDHVTYWYKVELLSSDGQYVPFLRNISYVLNIEGIETAGENTAEEAYIGPYFGNISASLETASLNQLSNGTSLIHVDQMDYTFMVGSTEDNPRYELLMNGADAAQFYFIPDQEVGTAYVRDEPGVCNVSVTIVSVSGHQPAVTAVEPNPEENGDGTIKITLAEVGGSIKKSILRVSGTNLVTNKTLYREITISLMDKQSFEYGSYVTGISNESPITDAVNQEVDIDIYLPEDLGASLFPIQIKIEAENNSLSATSPDLPVRTGKTEFGDKTRNTYYFVKTILYSDYCKLDPRTKKYEYTYKFPVKFYTSKASGNSTEIYVGDMADPETFESTTFPLTTVAPTPTP